MAKYISYIASIALMALLPVGQTKAQSTITVTQNGGKITNTALEKLRKIQFSNDETSVKVELVDGTSSDILLSDLRHITFTNNSTGISSIKTSESAPQVQFAIVGGKFIRVSSSEEITGVSIYTPNGQTIYNKKNQGSTSVEVDCSTIASGTFVISVQTKTNKVSRNFILK